VRHDLCGLDEEVDSRLAEGFRARCRDKPRAAADQQRVAEKPAQASECLLIPG
jgi:hypothetical protein